MITMAPCGSMRTSAIGRSALLAPRTARATSACVNLAGLRTRATTVRFLALMVGLQKNHPHRCPTAPLVERHAGCCCYLGGPSRPIAQILAAVSQELEGVLACRRAAPSVVVVHVPTATPRSCAWATCSRTCLQSTPFVRQDLALPSPPKSCMAALKLACKGRLRLAWKAKGGQQCLAHSCLKPRWRWTQAAPYRRQA